MGYVRDLTASPWVIFKAFADLGTAGATSFFGQDICHFLKKNPPLCAREENSPAVWCYPRGYFLNLLQNVISVNFFARMKS